MGIVSEDRASATRSVISLKEALRSFRNWKSSSILVRVSFLGKAAASGTVKVSMNGHVTLIDPLGIVTVAGEGREITLDLQVCELSVADSKEQPEISQPSGCDSALQLTFPNATVCLLFPCHPVSDGAHSRRPVIGSAWLRNTLGRTAPQSSPAMEPPSERPAESLAQRNLFVDVWHGQANIVELVETGSGKTRIRRLKE